MAQADSEDARPRKVLIAGPEAAGLRLDVFLAGALKPDLSRSRIQALVRSGDVSVDGVQAAEPKLKITEGMHVTIGEPEPLDADPAPEAIPLAVLYEDSELIVVNKPAGLVVHPGAGNPSGTLVNALLHHCGDSLSGIGGVKRPGIVHRLDKDTSGVMVAAKTDLAHRRLSEAFADHGRTGLLERAYLALVWGVPAPASGVIDAPLGRAGADRTRRAVVKPGQPDARHAVTRYATLDGFGGLASLVECRLETGRTHQIRVHMAHAGHPLVGDRDYGMAFRTKANRLPEPLRTDVHAFPRQALHARLLAFEHPVTGEFMRFEAPLPADLDALVAGFRAL